MVCPRCGREFPRLLALSRVDGKMMICDECGTKEALDSMGRPSGDRERERILAELYGKKHTPQERTREVVARTGNKWAIENFNATHN